MNFHVIFLFVHTRHLPSSQNTSIKYINSSLAIPNFDLQTDEKTHTYINTCIRYINNSNVLNAKGVKVHGILQNTVIICPKKNLQISEDTFKHLSTTMLRYSKITFGNHGNLVQKNKTLQIKALMRKKKIPQTITFMRLSTKSRSNIFQAIQLQVSFSLLIQTVHRLFSCHKQGIKLLSCHLILTLSHIKKQNSLSLGVENYTMLSVYIYSI